MKINSIFIEGIEFHKTLDKHDTPCVIAIGAKEDIEAAQAILNRNGYDASYLEWTECGWRVWGHKQAPQVSQAAWERVTAVLDDAKKVKRIRRQQQIKKALKQ